MPGSLTKLTTAILFALVRSNVSARPICSKRESTVMSQRSGCYGMGTHSRLALSSAWSTAPPRSDLYSLWQPVCLGAQMAGLSQLISLSALGLPFPVCLACASANAFQGASSECDFAALGEIGARRVPRPPVLLAISARSRRSVARTIATDIDHGSLTARGRALRCTHGRPSASTPDAEHLGK